MPKRALPVAAVAPITALRPPPPASPLIQRLRTDWRWAGISQFLWTFSDAFGFVDWDIENLEADLDGDEDQILPDLLAKLLYALTYNRQVNRDNALEHLRKQYAKRAPETNALGTVEEPVSWATLGLGQKIQILWELCEWQMVNAERFRALLKSEEESVQWRIDPLGWDKIGNTYFLFDDNRLWIQRLPPPPPRPPKKSSLKAKKSLKRSRPSAPPPKNSQEKRQISPPPIPPPQQSVEISAIRKRVQVAFYGNPTSTVEALKRNGRVSDNFVAPKNTRSTRQSGPPVASSSAPHTPSPSKPPVLTTRGTRISRRKRDSEADEWQQIPQEWLEPKPNGKGKMKAKQADEESELSELTDEDEHEATILASGVRRESAEVQAINGDGGNDVVMDKDQLTPIPDEPDDIEVELNGDAMGLSLYDQSNTATMATPKEESEKQPEGDAEMEEHEEAEDETDEVKLAVKAAADLPPDFVEWEAVCVTLFDWRTFPERFAKTRDPDEKILYWTLTEQVAPTVIEALVLKEQERMRQEAIIHRKRSSRIATRELEREEQLRHEQAHRDMEERMERSRREEKRAARQEEEFLLRERAREDRLKEREERAAAREDAILRQALADEQLKEARERRRLRREAGSAGAYSDDEDQVLLNGTSGTVTPRTTASNAKAKGGDAWELNCEVCRKTGWNLDDDADVVCCDDCGRWQHVECHNRQDASEGRRKRDWDKVDFKCKECRRKAARQHAPHTNGQTLRPITLSAPAQDHLPYPPPGLPIPPAGYAVIHSTSQSIPHQGAMPPARGAMTHSTPCRNQSPPFGSTQRIHLHVTPSAPLVSPRLPSRSSLSHTGASGSAPHPPHPPSPQHAGLRPSPPLEIQTSPRLSKPAHSASPQALGPHIVHSAVPHSSTHPFAPQPPLHDPRIEFSNQVPNGQPRTVYSPHHRLPPPSHPSNPSQHHYSPSMPSSYPPQVARPPHAPQAHRSPLQAHAAQHYLPAPHLPSPHLPIAHRPHYSHALPHAPSHQPESHAVSAPVHPRQLPPLHEIIGSAAIPPNRPMSHMPMQSNGPA